MQFLDLCFGFAARGPRFFADGWGDRELCDSLDPAAIARSSASSIEVKLGDAERAFGGLLREGTFESPEAARLPACSRRARVRLLVPEGELRGVGVHLAASGDQGFVMRLRFAAPLLAGGIGALVLENPFYGSRRPDGQVGPAVRSVSDLHVMGLATFQEGRSLLRWLREDLHVERVGITGFSMGGQMAAMVGASLPFASAIVPVAPTCSPDSVLRTGVLRDLAYWPALAADGEDAEKARDALCTHLSRFSVTALAPPVCPDAAIVVGTANDGVVPPSEMERIAQHWGCELRWIQAGHVSAVLRHQGTMRDAIEDAFDRLDAACGGALRPSGRARTRGRGSGPRVRGARVFAAVRGPSPDRAAGRRS